MDFVIKHNMPPTKCIYKLQLKWWRCRLLCRWHRDIKHTKKRPGNHVTYDIHTAHANACLKDMYLTCCPTLLLLWDALYILTQVCFSHNFGGEWIFRMDFCIILYLNFSWETLVPTSIRCIVLNVYRPKAHFQHQSPISYRKIKVCINTTFTIHL